MVVDFNNLKLYKLLRLIENEMKEGALKNIKAIDEKIKSAEKELAVLEAKRTELKTNKKRA